MSKGSSEGAAEERPIAEVDRIRDIIMGPQLRLYEQQFRRTPTQLEQLGKQLDELRAALDRQAADQKARTLQLQQEMQQRLDSLERNSTESLKQLETRMESQNADLSAQLRDRSAELRRQSQEMRDEFTKALAAVEDDKASRDHIGGLLVEMGTRLKEQAGIADLLGKLGKADAG
jgi:chromosome segregation ATPase